MTERNEVMEEGKMKWREEKGIKERWDEVNKDERKGGQ